MDVAEREQVLTLLGEGQTALLAALQGVSSEMAARVPGPGKWSILGCVEHMAFSEDYLFAQILAATVAETPAINPERESRMLARGTDRTRHVESPPEGHPKGVFSTLPAAVGHFLLARRRTVEFVESDPGGLRHRVTWHPILGAANCHEMLLSIAIHCLRHVKQIEEIKAEMAMSNQA